MGKRGKLDLSRVLPTKFGFAFGMFILGVGHMVVIMAASFGVSIAVMKLLDWLR